MEKGNKVRSEQSLHSMENENLDRPDTVDGHQSRMILYVSEPWVRWTLSSLI